MPDEWKRHCIVGTIPMHRPGWRGAWDAFKAAITRTTRLTVPTEVTFSVYANGDVKLMMAQVETKPL